MNITCKLQRISTESNNILNTEYENILDKLRIYLKQALF